MSRADILREIKGKPFFRAPVPLRAPAEVRDTTKHCDYHETHGHTTDSCISLKYLLERLVHEGQINQYLPRQITNGTPSNDKGNNPSTSNAGKNIVNMVIGGHQSPPPSPIRSEVLAISQQEQARIGITFNDDDFEGINPQHSEALVVSVEIANNIVKKVLIDNGSSVDILFMHCWERLKLEGYKLEECPKEAPLYGFGHNAVPSWEE